MHYFTLRFYFLLLHDFYRSIESMSYVCSKNNFTLERIDYNEASDGKDECDRKFSLLKRAMRYYIDEGNNILNAGDMMGAILKRCTNQHIKCQEITINSNKTVIQNYTKIPGITKIHSIQIDSQYMNLWHFFEIGKGTSIPLKQIKFTNGAEIVKPFESVSNLEVIPTTSSSFTSTSFVCEECNAKFRNETEYERHVLQEIAKPVSNWDQSIEIYKTHTSKMNQNIFDSESNSSSDAQTRIRSEIYDETFHKSWAIKTFKRGRFSAKQKLFLQACFKKGATSG